MAWDKMLDKDYFIHHQSQGPQEPQSKGQAKSRLRPSQDSGSNKQADRTDPNEPKYILKKPADL